MSRRQIPAHAYTQICLTSVQQPTLAFGEVRGVLQTAHLQPPHPLQKSKSQSLFLRNPERSPKTTEVCHSRILIRPYAEGCVQTDPGGLRTGVSKLVPTLLRVSLQDICTSATPQRPLVSLRGLGQQWYCGGPAKSLSPGPLVYSGGRGVCKTINWENSLCRSKSWVLSLQSDMGRPTGLTALVSSYSMREIQPGYSEGVGMCRAASHMLAQKSHQLPPGVLAGPNTGWHIGPKSGSVSENWFSGNFPLAEAHRIRP